MGRWWVAVTLLLAAAAAWGGTISLAVGAWRHPAFEAEGVSVRFDAFRRGAAEIRVARLRLGEQEYRQVQLHCADFVVDSRHLDCPRGEIRRQGGRGAERRPLPFSLAYRFGDGQLDLTVSDVEAVAFSPLIRRLRAWQPEGRVNLRLMVNPHRAELQLAVRDLRFANRAGDVAGEGIALTLAATAERHARAWAWRASGEWSAGELYRAPWYRKAGVRIAAAGELTAAELNVNHARLDLDGVGGVNAGLTWDRHRGEPVSWGLVTERLDLAAAVAEWLQPWLDQSALPKLKASGAVRFAVQWSAGHLHSFYAGIEDANLTDGTDYIDLRGVNARLPWERDGGGLAEIEVAGGRLGDLPLGGFHIPLRVLADAVRLDRLTVPLLDGRLIVDGLMAERTAQGWRGRFSGGIEAVSMLKLTRALRLPPMAGTLTARIPAAVYGGGVLSLDGGLAIEVFDGRVAVRQLRIVEPLRASRRFLADVEARGLDLGMLTQTFSFGSILGRFDADIHGLEMQGWRPLGFRARLASSAGDFPRAISRGALQDISALGGAAGAAAVRRSPAGLFNSFDYERIGIGCELRDGVCHMDGLEPAGEGYLLVAGRGIPRVQVIGYNRRIDWNLLVSRIQAVIADRVKPIIE